MRCRGLILATSLVMMPLGSLAPGLQAGTPGTPRSEQELRSFYHRTCVICHGEDGSAVSASGRKLRGRDFTSEKGMSEVSDQALVKTIQNGISFGLSMPAYKRDLTEEEAWLLVRNILRKARRGEPILAQTSEPKRAQAIPPPTTR